MAESRTDAFQSGAPMQLHVFKPSSVLDANMLIKNANGQSQKDAERNLVGGGQLPSMNGSAEDTYNDRRALTSTLY